MVHVNGHYEEDEDVRMLNECCDDAEKQKLIQMNRVMRLKTAKNDSALIDMKANDQQAFSGLTKDELMNFAKDPFWVWFRWLLVTLFWGIGVAVLIGVVYITMDARKCPVRPPRTWYHIGPLVIIEEDDYKTQVDTLQSFGAKGVIYKLPADETYRVDTAPVENKIKELVGTFNATNIKVILDLTPNFVTKDDQLFKDALAGIDSASRSAFIWKQSASVPTNWIALEGGSAWKEVATQQFVLAQFGPDRFDLQLNDPLAKKKLKNVLRHLAQLGVRGFRLANARHFIVDRDGKDDVKAEVDNKILKESDYEFWKHLYTTYQDGLGALLRELVFEVKNATNNEGFLSVSDDIYHPDLFIVNGESGLNLGIELPLYGDLEKVLRQTVKAESAEVIRDAFGTTYFHIKYFNTPIGGKPRIQLPYNKDSLAHVGASEWNIFMFLLPGVPVVPLDVLNYGNSSQSLNKRLTRYRATPSYLRGWYGMYNDANKTSVGYFRQKPGHLGYFVALNLANRTVEADFSHIEEIAEELTVVLASDNYHVPQIGTHSKIACNAVPLSARSALMALYDPKCRLYTVLFSKPPVHQLCRKYTTN